MSAIPAKVRAVVLERANGRCERCGASGGVELHHRKFRKRGGKHTVCNLIALCGWGNHTGCHGFAHSANKQASQGGWSVASWHDPAAIPVLMLGAWTVLDDAGGTEVIGVGEATELMLTFGIWAVGEVA